MPVIDRFPRFSSRWLLLLLVGLCCISFHGNPKKTEDPAPRVRIDTAQIIAAFEQQVKAEAEQEGMGSISACVFVGDRIIAWKAAGKADSDSGVNADTSTIYRIGSLSKSITSYLMMLLVQEGKVQLDDPVSKYVPEILQVKQNGRNEAGNITLRQLASHSSGLAREPDLADASSGPIGDWESKLLKALPTTNMPYSPGERYLYSNIGYATLGLALSRAAQQPFMDMIVQRVLKPMQMNSSFFIIPPGYAPRIAAGYHRTPSGDVDAKTPLREHAGRGYRVPNGGIYATPGDYARFIMNLEGKDSPLKRKYREVMQSIQIHENSNAGYGFGFSVSNGDPAMKIVSHTGSVPGYLSYMVFNPDTRIGVVIMKNYDYGMDNLAPSARAVVRQLVKGN